jgi:predicted lactoylglutathione lyase
VIGYTMVGVRDLDRAAQFYDPLFEVMGIARQFTDEEALAWGHADETTARFIACLPFDGAEASVGNGTMTAFLVDGTETIDRLHTLALENGGSDEGAPGRRPRYGEGFYGAYARDRDGNKIAFVCYDAPPEGTSP